MWLQLSQILKEFTEGNARKLALIFTRDVTVDFGREEM